MKLNKIALIPLTALLLVGCADGGNTANSESSSQTSTSEATTDEEITLKMMGDIYENGYRTIYAFLKNGTDSEIGWTSSNEEVATVAPRTNLTTEGNVMARGIGKTTITAYLVDYPGNKATMEIEIKKGTPMPKELFDTLSGSLRADSTMQVISYDKELNGRVTEKFKYEAIFEEYKEFENDATNTTDGFYYKATNIRTLKKIQEINIVRSPSGYVSKEYLDLYNNVQYEKVTKENFEDGEKWLATTAYKNPFFNIGTTNESFTTVDGGKTYHFVDGDEAAQSITNALFLTNDLAQDIYFEVGEDNELTLNIVYDPYNQITTQSVRGGFIYQSKFSENGTAKINHVTPKTEQPYHAGIKTALETLANDKNFTVEYTLDYPGSDNDYKTKQIYTPTDINEVKSDMSGRETAFGGVHKENEDAYYGYKRVGDKVVKKPLTGVWASEYPNFNFSPLIFEPTENPNEYQTCEDDMGLFIAKMMRLPSDFYLFKYSFTRGFITLGEDGNISSVKTSYKDLDEGTETFITANFTKIGTSNVDHIDFSKFEFEKAPENWAQYGGTLYQDLIDWNLLDVVPFKWPQVSKTRGGYYPNVHTKKESGVLIHAALTTYKFELDDGNFDFEARDKFIAEYKELLLANGWTATEEKANTTAEIKLYNKDSYYIGVGYDQTPGFSLNDNNPAQPKDYGGAIIVIQGPLVVEPTP